MKATNKERGASLRFVIVTAVLGALLLIIANSGLWVNQYIFNETKFSEVETEALTSDSSKTAIAGAVTSTMYQGRPVVGAILTEPTANIVQGLLGSRQVEAALGAATTRLNIVLTSKEKEAITLDLSGLKSTLTRLVGITGDRGADRINPEAVPDTIMLFDTARLPDLYGYATVMLFLSPLAFLIALLLLAWPLVRHRADWQRIVRIQGTIILAGGLLAQLIGPIFRPITLSVTTEPAQRVVLANVYDAFIATFSAQTVAIGVIGFVMLIAPSLYTGTLKLRTPGKHG